MKCRHLIEFHHIRDESCRRGGGSCLAHDQTEMGVHIFAGENPFQEISQLLDLAVAQAL